VLDDRTETMRLIVNQLVDMLNRIRDFFLDRDGTTGTTEQPGVWMRGDFDMGGFKVVRLAAATLTADAITFEQLQDVQFEGEDELEQILDAIVFKLDGSAVAGAPLNMNNFRVIAVGDPVGAAVLTQPSCMMRKDLVDASVVTLTNSHLPRNGALPMTGDLSFDGPVVTDPGFIPNNIANPTANADMVNKSYLDTQVLTFGGQDVPVATVLPFGGGTVPANFLICDGREVSRFVYQNLFNTIGIAYGTPTSSSVFKLPDLRGRVIVGKDNMGGGSANVITAPQADQLGGQLGAQSHGLTQAELPAHDHTYDDHVFATGAAGAETGGDDGTDANNVQTDTVRTSGSSGSGGNHNNVQPSMAVDYIIRY